MSFIQLSRKRILAIVIAFSILIISIIVPPYVSAANNVPSNMLNNVFLNALEYTGYDVKGKFLMEQFIETMVQVEHQIVLQVTFHIVLVL